MLLISRMENCQPLIYICGHILRNQERIPQTLGVVQTLPLLSSIAESLDLNLSHTEV